MKFKATVTEQKQPKINNRVALEAFMSTFEVGDIVDVDICKEKKQRSLSQNRLMWALFEEIDKLMHNDDKDRTKWQVLIHIGHFDEYEIKGRKERLPRTTSKLAKKTFIELIDKIIRFGVVNLGVDLTPIATRGY